MGTMDVGEEAFPVAVTATDALRSFGQIVLRIQDEAGQEKIFCLPPIRAAWLIAQLETAMRLPD
ncbi:hypothetical protein [Solimonas terrae]|uniref:Uncharacterized protein n=1 Tax=Solimonas terrae TaxID=1396819 RepID=A0A6M2BPC3_9GAMM|nr:hypothetical protein [Solimonas terrae]NGY04081.1 hypothetical protein [Solimonas terrae]